ncbi:Hypothetical lipoprotein precursor [Flavobacterium indicum GPTSA100-9 = DSM 17447]|uniref:Hypothetical lipoprotein n=1 Tax=Flavobacterium indicum (strain DSM 17447 / CIP 109464 / GPTSA100-9) TaxID=1094466 RepID=H8XV20_FLAIG|nr:hypothetical protein [Flavobacterium indicum]CCG52990.1 Hypothetical lipoprotein precursor [Flavobacterium indicum GPTSA100-9 = DSM 17447]
MRTFAFLAFGILLISCRNSNGDLKTQNEKKEQKNISAEQLAGKWYLNKWTYYHTLVFNEHSIYVDNHIDSVFFLKFRLSHDTLITWSDNPKKVSKNRILKVSKDTLIFEEFLNIKHKIGYSKTEREFEN